MPKHVANPYEELANGIVAQSAKEYRAALESNKKLKNKLESLKSAELFLRSLEAKNTIILDVKNTKYVLGKTYLSKKLIDPILRSLNIIETIFKKSNTDFPILSDLKSAQEILNNICVDELVFEKIIDMISSTMGSIKKERDKIESIERWFKSCGYGRLTMIDGEYILNRIKNEVGWNNMSGLHFKNLKIERNEDSDNLTPFMLACKDRVYKEDGERWVVTPLFMDEAKQLRDYLNNFIE